VSLQINLYICNNISYLRRYELKNVSVDYDSMSNRRNHRNMAKKILKEKTIEESLWESANKLRGSVEPSEYKHVVLSLHFFDYHLKSAMNKGDLQIP